MKRCVLWRPIGHGRMKKYYGILDKRGEPKTVQSYKHAHGQDIRRSSKAERQTKSLA